MSFREPFFAPGFNTKLKFPHLPPAHPTAASTSKLPFKMGLMLGSTMISRGLNKVSVALLHVCSFYSSNFHLQDRQNGGSCSRDLQEQGHSSFKFNAYTLLRDAAFLLTVGSFLLTVELFYLQLTIFAFLLTVGAFCLQFWLFTYSWSFFAYSGTVRLIRA